LSRYFTNDFGETQTSFPLREFIDEEALLMDTESISAMTFVASGRSRWIDGGEGGIGPLGLVMPLR
jgi:hypothetical protein